MMGVAAFMGASTAPNQISPQGFESTIKALYERIPITASWGYDGLVRTALRPVRVRLQDLEDPIQEIVNDVRACGILVFDDASSGMLRFAHKSFLEYLVGKVYADFILRNERESSTAIIAITHLSATDILNSPESSRFLAEIVLVSVGKRSPSGVETATRLFQRVVIGSLGGGLPGKIRARLALRRFASAAILAIRPQRHMFLQLILSSTLLFGALVPAILATLGLALLRVLHYDIGERMLVGAALLSQVVFFLTVMERSDKLAYSSVRLWFQCCLAIGLQHTDIDSSIGFRIGTSRALKKVEQPRNLP